MKKLEIELYRYENLVFGKILHQNEILRNKGIIAEKDDFKIESYSSPELCRTKLLIRGENEEDDNDVFYNQFLDEETAIKTCKKIVDCVDLINSEEEKQSGVERTI